MAMSEIDLRKKIGLKLRSSGRFSIFLKFPLCFSWISYIKYDPDAGGDLSTLRHDLNGFSHSFRSIDNFLPGSADNPSKNMLKVTTLIKGIPH